MSDSTPMIRAICKAFAESSERSPSLLCVSAVRGFASVATRSISWAGHVANKTERSPETARAQRIMDFGNRIAMVASLLVSKAESWNKSVKIPLRLSLPPIEVSTDTQLMAARLSQCFQEYENCFWESSVAQSSSSYQSESFPATAEARRNYICPIETSAHTVRPTSLQIPNQTRKRHYGQYCSVVSGQNCSVVSGQRLDTNNG